MNGAQGLPAGTAPPVPNLAYALTQAARRCPDDDAAVHREIRWTWSQLDGRVHALAAALTAGGIETGDVVMMHSPNCLDVLTVMHACWRVGAVWAPTNFRVFPDELQQLARVCEPRLLICHDDFGEHAAALDQTETWSLSTSPDRAASATFAVTSVAAEVERHVGQVVTEVSPPADQVAWLFFTSGSSGTPKVAQLTHGQMGFVVTSHLCDLMPDLRQRDATLLLAPLSHGAGVHVLPHVACGAKIVLLPTDGLDVEAAWETIERERISTLFTVPTILASLSQYPELDRFDHSSLRYVIYAGAPITAKDQRVALERLGPVLVQYYGLGEVTGNITVHPPWRHSVESGDATPTAGYERTAMQIAIRDADGAEVPAGDRGEITVCGLAVFPGYLRNPEANERAFRDGWFWTGDLGYVDETGRLFITGRASDMYISGGSNIDPREIEEKLVGHTAIRAVGVVGVPDAKWGEVGVALCVTAEGSTVTEDELRAWCRGKMASYKVPKRIHFVDSLTTSAYGKVTKTLLLSQLQGLDEMATRSAA